MQCVITEETVVVLLMFIIVLFDVLSILNMKKYGILTL